jgi:hypothetical protein
MPAERRGRARPLAVIALVAILVLSLGGGPALADAAAQPAPATPPVDARLALLGAGAVLGVVAFGLLTGPLGTAPLAGGTLAPVPIAVSLGSRLIAATAAAAGGLGAAWIYSKVTGRPVDMAYGETLAVGALGGVAIGNLLAGGLGVIPYYAGSGVAIAGPYGTAAFQAASRIYVVTSGVLGAWAADWWYRSQPPAAPAQ